MPTRTSTARPIAGFLVKPMRRRSILAGAIAPAVFASSALAVDVFIPPSFTIDSDLGSPLYLEGLIEGKTLLADDDGVNDGFGNTNPATPNPGNSTPELGLRMATINQNPGGGQIADGWGNPATWIYTGQIFTGANGTISFAANNDDTDWLRINGVQVLNDNGWDTTAATVVSGLTPNSWVDFEYRVSDTGGGGAGPSGQNINGASNWNGTRGAVISHDNEANSLNAADYTFGLSGVNSYGDADGIADATMELFRYQNGFGFNDDFKITASGSITINGTNATVTEPSITFQASGATLTVSDGTGSHKTLSLSNGTTLGNANGQSNTIGGTTDVRTGKLLDGGFTGLTLTHVGPGLLIVDDLSGTGNADGATLASGTGGNIRIRGSVGISPIATLGTLAITGAGGAIDIGSAGSGTTFNTPISATESGTINHTTATIDTLGGAITIAATKTLTLNNTGSPLKVTGSVGGAGTLGASGTGTVQVSGTTTPGAIVSSAATLLLNGPTTVPNLTVNAGRTQAGGVLTLTNSPVIANGATLALANTAGTNSLPAGLTVPTGNLEVTAGSLGAVGQNVDLSGGTLTLVGYAAGLNAYLYGNDDGGANANFGNFANYSDYFLARGTTIGQGGLEAVAVTTAGGITQLSFDPAGGDTAMFSAYGQTRTNNIVSRFTGKLNITTAGNYTFGTTSDDGSMIYINGTQVVNNNFYQGMTRRTGTIALGVGLHDIEIGFYEGGGGNGLVVDWDQGTGSTVTTPNSIFSTGGAANFNNPITVSQDSALNVTAGTSTTASSVTVASGRTLTMGGGNLTISTLALTGSATLSPSNTVVVNQVTDGGAAVAITKSGTGLLVLDPSTNHLQQAGSSITINQGTLGLPLGGPVNPTGVASIVFNGGGVALGNKAGTPQSYAIPAFSGDGIFEARQVGSSLPGPQTINLTGNLNLPGAQSVTLGAFDNYILNVGGTSSGTGTVKINGGAVNVTSAGGINGFKLVMNPAASANLTVATSVLSLQSIAREGNGTATITAGSGGAGTVTLNGSDTARYTGALNEAGGSTLSIIRSGTGKQTFVGDSSFTGGVTVNSGTLEFVGTSAIDSNAITLNGGTLQLLDTGLNLRIYNADPNATGAYGGILNTLAGVNAHYATLGAAVTNTLTSANGNTVISYNPSGNDTTPPFGIHGNTQLDNIQAIFTGKFYAETAGNYTFRPRSDDGTMVYINGALVVNNNFGQGIGDANQPGRDGTVSLGVGSHDITMIFNEGGGGAGMFVNVTRPTGGTSLMANTELSTNFTGSNVVNLNASATINPQGTTTTLGTLNHAVGTTLTTTVGTVAFGSSNLAAGAHGFDVAAGGTMIPGQIVDGAAAITINKTGAGNLLLNGPLGQLGNLSSAINVNAGQLTAVGGGVAAPLGNATVNLAAGSTLALSSTGGAASFNAPVSVTGSAALTAGNFGGGAVNGPVTTTLTSPLSVGGGNTLTVSSTNSYTLALGGALTGGGNLAQSSGLVETNAAVNLTGSVTVNGGTLRTNGTLTAAAVNVNSGATLRTFNAVNGAVNVNNNATLQVNGNSVSGAVLVDGGLIQAAAGLNDFGSGAITATPYVPNNTANALRGRFLDTGTGGSLYPGNTDAGILAATTLPAVEQTLTSVLDFGPNGAGDAAISTFFGGVNTGGRFTMAFVGNFTAPATAAYQAQAADVDDFGGFWVDLNRNGLFESTGSAGSELISSQGCCGDGPVGTANLIAGQTYRVAMAVEDTGGGGSYEARVSAGGPLVSVNPGDVGQTGLWSFDAPTGGGTLRIDGGAEIRAGSVSNIRSVALTGTGATFQLTGAASNTVNALLTLAGSGTSNVTIGTGGTLTATNLTVAPGTTLVKTGAGAVTATNQSLGNGSTLQVDGGTVNLQGTLNASNGAANGGNAVVNNTGTLNVTGAISGGVTVNSGGTLKGSGSVGATAVNTGGFLAPGTSPGTITTGNLTLAGTLQEEILSLASYDITVANGTVDLTSGTLSLALLDPSQLVVGDKLFIIQNDAGEPVTGNFTGLVDNATITVGLTQFQITYDADFGTLALDGGNDVALLVLVPEPTSLTALLGGLGAIAGLRRFRRRG